MREEPFLSYEPHSAAHPETERLLFLPIYSTPDRESKLENYKIKTYLIINNKILY